MGRRGPQIISIPINKHHRRTRRSKTAHGAMPPVVGCGWRSMPPPRPGRPGDRMVARARRSIESRDCVEHGYLLLAAAEQDLAEGRIDAAQTAATSACAIGARFNDVDLIVCARHLQGRALVQEGRIRQGLGVRDEAMLAVVGGELSPMMTGLIYCSVIDTCQHVHAVSRARDWTAAFARWCEQQPRWWPSPAPVSCTGRSC